MVLMDTYKSHKPLRNRLRKVSLEDVFYVIWAYSRNLHFNDLEIPKDIQVDPSYLNAERWIEGGIYPWNLEILVRESLLNGSYSSYHPQIHKTFKKWSYFANAHNNIRDIEGDISKERINAENIISAMNLIAHRQFHWQTLPQTSYYMRYYKIFSEEKVNAIIEAALGISVYEIYVIGLAMVGAYLGSPAINFPITIELKTITSAKVRIFLGLFGKELNELKELVQSEHKMDEDFHSVIPSLRMFPVIHMVYCGQEAIVCPMPSLLFWRMTSGLYYDIVKIPETGFDNAFGSSFEKYVGNVIEATIDSRIERKRGEDYKIGKEKKETSDWVVWDDKGILLIECKTKRMRLDSKSSLDETFIEKDLEKMAEFVFQLYKSMLNYKNGEYPFIDYASSRKIYPMVLTLENWHIMGTERFTKINELAKAKLVEAGIDPICIEENPYTISSIDEFEYSAQVLSQIGISEFMEEKVGSKYRYYQLRPYQLERFVEESKTGVKLWDAEHDAIFKF